MRLLLCRPHVGQVTLNLPNSMAKCFTFLPPLKCTCCSAIQLGLIDPQVGQVILNLPNSMAKCGMILGTFFQVMCASAAVYTLWLLSTLYQEFKRTAVSVAPS